MDDRISKDLQNVDVNSKAGIGITDEGITSSVVIVSPIFGVDSKVKITKEVIIGISFGEGFELKIQLKPRAIKALSVDVVEAVYLSC